MKQDLTAIYTADMQESPSGEKIHEKVKGRKYQRTSIVAGKMGANIIAPLEYTGTMHGDFLKLGLFF